VSVIVGRRTVLVARSAIISAVSLSVMPIWDGIHINSICFFVKYIWVWIFCVIYLSGRDFGVPGLIIVDKFIRN